MASDEDARVDNIERLRRLGLTPTAAKAYLALIGLGETQARDVARVSGIPFAKVYAALDELHARGLAQVILDAPRRYAPLPIGDYLASLQSAQAQRLRELDMERTELEMLLQIKPKSAGDDRGSFEMIRGRRGSTNRVKHMIQKAEVDILLLSTENFPARAHLGSHLMSDASSRGVRIRILAQNPPAETPRLARALPDAQIRLASPGAGTEHVAMLVADRAQALVIHYVPDDADLEQGHDVGIHTSQEAIVGSLYSLLDARWSAAKPTARDDSSPLLMPELV